MNNSLSKIKKEIKHFIKKNKTVKYSQALLVTFLISGGLGIANETDISKVANQISTKIKEERKVNKKKLNTSKIELLQLEEQGNQVVKSPWSSWQFSADYTYADMGNEIKGTNDKADLYNERYTAGNSGRLLRALDAKGNNIWWLSKLVPGSQAHQDVSASLYGTTTAMGDINNTFGTSLSSLNPDDNQYGITSTRIEYETPAVLQVNASIKPKTPTIGVVKPNVGNPTVVSPTIPTVTIKDLDTPIFEGVEAIDFQPLAPVVNLPTLNPLPVIAIGGAGGGNGGRVGFFPNGDPDGNAIISQMNIDSGEIYAKIDDLNWTGGTGYLSKVRYEYYTFNNLVGSPSAGLTFSHGGVALPLNYDSRTAAGGPYNPYIQGIFKSVDDALTRIGTPNNTSSLEVTLEGDLLNPQFLGQILHYDEHYDGMRYNLETMRTNGWITTLERDELASKFLDINAGHNINNRMFQFVENNGTWNLKGRGIVAVNLQAHEGNQEENSFFSNRGVIRGLNEASSTNNAIGRQVAFMFTEGNSQKKHEGFDNTGLIEMRAEESVIYLLTSSASSSMTGKHILMNNGDMKLYGRNSVGIYMDSASATLGRTEIKLHSPITILGDNSVGIGISRNLNFANSVIKLDIGTENPEQDVANASGVNTLKNSGEAGGAGYSNKKTDNSAGIYVNLATAFTIDDYEINLGAHSANSIGVRVNNGNITLGHSTNPTSRQIISSNGGIGNMLLVAEAGTSITTNANTVLELKNGNSQIGLFATGVGATITNAGNLTGSGNGTKGIVAQSGGNITNTGNINISGGVYDNGTTKSGSVGIAVKDTGSSFSSTAGTVTVDVTGTESTGVFAETGTLSISNANIKASNGATTLFSKGAFGMITLGGGTLEAGQKSLLFYNETGGKFNFTGAISATIRGGNNPSDRGTAFYYTGAGLTPLTVTDLNIYLGTTFNTTINQLTLNMDPGSRLFVVDDVAIDLDNTSITGIAGVTINGTDYKTYMMYKSLLNINQNVYLDILTDDYNYLEIAASSITNQTGFTMSGSKVGQVAMAQQNGLTSGGALLPKGTVTLTNDGTITLTGSNSTGIYAAYGVINNSNTGIINVGDTSLGVYSIKGSQTTNSGSINVGDAGVGIYAINDSKLTPANPIPTVPGADKDITVTNNGSITTTGINKGFGIYVDNYLALPVGQSNLTLSGTSNINLSSVINTTTLGDAVALYANRTTVSTFGGSAGTITVGKNGVGIVVDNGSNVTLNGLTLNLFGDNAVGIQVLNGSTFTGSGTINISGQNITLFNLGVGVTTFNQSFTINPIGTSTYSYGSVLNSQIYHNSLVNLSGGSTFLDGGATAALYDTGSVITASGNTVVGMALNGAYAPMPTVINGVTLTEEGTNRGTMTLMSDSIGLYGKLGASLLNDASGKITVGSDSAGIFIASGTGTQKALNNGEIIVGSNSVGVYGKEIGTVNNNPGAKIESLNNSNVVGMRLDSNATTASITNAGTINLSGDNLIGIYSEGTPLTTAITNTRTINILNTNPGSSNVGIYSVGTKDNIVQNGNLTVGLNGVALYGKDITLGGSSSTSVGAEGVLIYSEGASNIIINPSANITIGAGGKGIYAKDAVNINVDSNYSLTGNSAVGTYLDTGSVATTYTNASSNVTMDSNSIYVYSKTGQSSNITNNAAVTVSGNDNSVLYGIGDNITNNGVLDLTSGIDNIGIYSNAGSVTNSNVIKVGKGTGRVEVSTGVFEDGFGIGIAVENNSSVTNNSDIYLTKDQSIGIFASGAGTTVTTAAGTNIYLDPTGSVTQMIGIYAEGGAKVINRGNISTVGNYAGDNTKEGLFGIVLKGTTTERTELENYGNITINADKSAGVYIDGAIIKNYGNITVTGSETSGVRYIISQNSEGADGSVLSGSNINGTSGLQTGTINGNAVEGINPSDTSKTTGDIEFDMSKGPGKEIVKLEGVEQTPFTVAYEGGKGDNTGYVKGLGIYIDSLGKTKPISDSTGLINSSVNQVIIGAEASEKTSETTIVVGGDVLSGFNQYFSGMANPKVVSGALLWSATLASDAAGYDRVLLQKRKFTEFAVGSDVTNFADGLDKIYDSAKPGTRDKEVFNKLNDIGATEEKLLFQAYDEMMGQPYANTQQRIMASGNLIDKGIDSLFRWDTASKQSNKVQAIGGRSNYKTNTAGVVDYKQTSGGIVYLNEHETVKLGNSSGWYAGLLQSRFDFDDIGESKEDATIGKVGVYKSTSFDNNDSLNWKIKGDISAGYHKMNRKFLVVDEIYNAKGDYYSYGMNVINEISKDFRISKNVKVGALASLELGYGQFTDIKEDKGEIKLEVKGNDYYSIKPAVGGRISFDKKVGTALTFKTELLAVVEQELGKVTNVENQAKVANTTADYFNLRKDKREKTNGKIGLNLELGTSRFGFNINGEYNTEGENSQIGAGFKFVF